MNWQRNGPLDLPWGRVQSRPMSKRRPDLLQSSHWAPSRNDRHFGKKDRTNWCLSKIRVYPQVSRIINNSSINCHKLNIWYFWVNLHHLYLSCYVVFPSLLCSCTGREISISLTCFSPELSRLYPRIPFVNSKEQTSETYQRQVIFFF